MTQVAPPDPLFVTAMPDGYSRDGAEMGLTEAIAWIAARNKRLSDAAYWWLHESGDSGGPLMAFVDLADALGDAAVGDAEDDLFRAIAEGRVEAMGRRRGPPHSKMDRSAWINARIGFEVGPDAITTRDTQDLQFFEVPAWRHIVLWRSEVLALWPEQAAAPSELLMVESTPPLPRATNSELQEWVAAQVALGKRQAYCDDNFRRAVPGKRVPQTRPQVREMYDTAYLERHGQAPRPGPPRRA